MKKSILLFLSIIASLQFLLANDINRAGNHPIVYDKPSINFFEGAVLGNGGMGVIVTARPDAICFYIGHNNVWDIRVAEDNGDKIGTFEEVFAKAKAIPENLHSIWDDKEFSDYLNMTADNYRKPYPRPFPCGTVIIGLDRRKMEVLGHKIDIENGLCEVYMLNDRKKIILQIFVDANEDIIHFRLVDENGAEQPSCFNRFRVIPDSHTPKDIPHYSKTDNVDGVLGFSQVLPYQEPDVYDMQKGHPKDKMFRLEGRLSNRLTDGVRYTNQGTEEPLKELEKYIGQSAAPFMGSIALTEGRSSDVKQAELKLSGTMTSKNYKDSWTATKQSWADYWSKSGVQLSDDYLEKIWYWNLYFFNCSVKEGVTCPGIYANWSAKDIGTVWHGDYHLNYNTQQPFWVTFSSNHLDKNLPYVDLVDHMLPISKKWAKEYYNMRGAFFPHSAYPVDMNMHPYPVPDWGWEVFETPWVVQGLWWHYKYSMDKVFLRDRAFEPMKEAVLFLVDYMKRPEAYGKQWNDTKYHIFPSVPPELYGLQPGFKFNYDTQIDITLAKFIFNAYLEAVDILGCKKAEANLIKEVKQILPNMPEYSTTLSSEYGEIYTSVPGETDKIVYNVPANLTHVFPGEEYGIASPKGTYDKLVNTYYAHQNEGGNDIVFINLQAARLGILDLDKFKRHVNYAMLPNKTVSDIVLQTGGRYDDQTDFAYMAPMGIWFENFALPAVINECLMQSYNGIINLFPNWDMNNKAAFSTLRAMGAFLVSSSVDNGNVEYIHIRSEKGADCKILNPWKDGKVQVVRNGQLDEVVSGSIISLKTDINEKIELSKIN